MPKLMSPGECRPVGRAYVPSQDGKRGFCRRQTPSLSVARRKTLRSRLSGRLEERHKHALPVLWRAGLSHGGSPWWRRPLSSHLTSSLGGSLVSRSWPQACSLRHGLFGSYRRRSGTLGAVPIRLALQTSELLSPPDNGPLASATCGARSSIGALAGNTGRSDSAP